MSGHQNDDLRYRKKPGKESHSKEKSDSNSKHVKAGYVSQNNDGQDDQSQRTTETVIEHSRAESNYSSSIQTNDNTWLYYSLLLFVTVCSFVTRLYHIELPRWVCWDETHFGKMGSWYIKKTFFFDVHPPLGKMLIGLAGNLTGYDGQFAFEKPGDFYEDTNYVGMRVFCACLGAMLVPLTYMSTWLLCQSAIAALFAGMFVLFDTGVSTLSRYILLDPILMFFIMASTYCVLKFISLRHSPFTVTWWLWLVNTGFFLACAIGVKFVGLFVILLAGLSTIQDLWRLLGNTKMSLINIFKHFVARAVCLILLPAVFYMLFFGIHFKVLSKTGGGDGFYSSQFQSQLEGNRLHNISMPEHVAYGSIFSLKQRRTGGGYLHSHWHLYPEEVAMRQQQVTSYSHKDENNMWMMKQALEEPDRKGKPVLLKNGDLIRLEHVITRRNLHSHMEPAPLTHRHFQVTGYGEDGRGDANDLWQIEVQGSEIGTPVMAVRSKIRLIHYHVKCALQSHDKKLPKWGWEQLEVTCNPNQKDPKTLWSIEEVVDPRLPNVSFEVHSPSFAEMFIESHSVMTQGNAGLKPKEGEMTSRPWQWPINYRGQIFSGKDHRVYLLGNPIIFYTVLALMGLFLVLYSLHAIRNQRGAKTNKHLKEFSERTFSACWWLMLGWALHYLPFWPMTRVLYFHHYFPAFIYNCMLAGVILDYSIKMMCNYMPSSASLPVFHWCVGCVLAAMAYSFYLFHPLTYGMSGPMAIEEGSSMYGLKWLDSWEF